MKRDFDDVNLAYENARKLYEEMKKEKALVNYAFPSRPSSDGYYHVYVPDSSRPSGRRQIKAKNLENLKEKVYRIETKTFRDVFDMVQDNRLKYVKNPTKRLSVQNSITCIDYDYNRYFKGTKFEKLFVDEIRKEDIENICMLNLQRYDLGMKAFLSLRSILKSVLNLAYENYWIQESPYNRVNFNKYEAMLVEPKPSKDRVHSDDEIQQMLDYIHKHQAKKPWFIPAYAMEMQILMGLRRGEIPPIEWNDVSENFILISKEQILIRKGPNVKKGYCKIVEHTKTHRNRKFPITTEIESLLKRLRPISGDGKYLFPSKTTDNGVISNTAVYRFYSRMCNNLGIEISNIARKGPHSFRRNGITKVANEGSILMASVLYGNSVQTAAKHYYTGIDLQEAKTILEG